MADYKTIHGINIRDYTTDPDTLITGQVWYDTTNKVLQFQATGAGAWSTTNNLNTARDQIAGAGTTTSALFYGGYVGTPSYSALTESWNGTSMTEVNDMASGRGSMGALHAGSSVSQIAASGSGTGQSSTEEWTVPESNLTLASTTA